MEATVASHMCTHFQNNFGIQGAINGPYRMTEVECVHLYNSCRVETEEHKADKHHSFPLTNSYLETGLVPAML